MAAVVRAWREDAVHSGVPASGREEESRGVRRLRTKERGATGKIRPLRTGVGQGESVSAVVAVWLALPATQKLLLDVVFIRLGGVSLRLLPGKPRARRVGISLFTHATTRSLKMTDSRTANASSVGPWPLEWRRALDVTVVCSGTVRFFWYDRMLGFDGGFNTRAEGRETAGHRTEKDCGRHACIASGYHSSVPVDEQRQWVS